MEINFSSLIIEHSNSFSITSPGSLDLQSSATNLRRMYEDWRYDHLN